jgi:uncharacterized protein YbaR (Trm112 family)
MKLSTLAFLRCPTCHAELTLEGNNRPGSIETGWLVCHAYRKSYPIQRGIPHFITHSELAGRNKTFAQLYDWFSLTYRAFSKLGFRLLGTTDWRARRELFARLGRMLERCWKYPSARG